MLRKILLGLLFVVFAAALFFGISYQQMSDEVLAYAPIKKGAEDRIIFFDIGNGDRSFISALIDSIQLCGPKVLAVDVYFQERKAKKPDALLRNSLSSPNVVLASRHDGKKTHAVHEYFLQASTSYGYAQSMMEGRFTSASFNLSQGNSYHFAYKIAELYDLQAARSFREQNRGQPMEIVFTRLENQFKVYNFRDFSFNCEEIRDKIAYLGYFGDKEDLHVTRARYHEDSKWISTDVGKPDMHGSVVVANQLLMILDDVKQPDK